MMSAFRLRGPTPKRSQAKQQPPAQDATALPKPKYIIELHEPTIVIVGPVNKCKTFQIPDTVFYSHAPFLAHLLQQPMESKTRIIMLPDADPAIFELWLPHVNIHPKATVSEPPTHLPDTFTTLARLYVLAQRLGDVQTRNRLVFSATERFSRERVPPSPADVTLIWKGTPATSPMRRLVVLIWAMYGGDEALRTGAERFPADFFVQLAQVLMGVRLRNAWGFGQWHTGLMKVALSLME